MSVNLDAAMVSVVGFGFAGLITVIGFFLKRLVDTQDKHGEALTELGKTAVDLGARVRALEVVRR